MRKCCLGFPWTILRRVCGGNLGDLDCRIAGVPYASAVGSLMYAMLCTRPDICFAIGMVRRYQSNPGPEHWTAAKKILKYLRKTKDYIFMYGRDELIPIGYTDSDFISDKNLRKSTSGHVFTLGMLL